ncbi:MAG: class I SAM-dependent methyltransferase [Ginsengibacter sp.]
MINLSFDLPKTYNAINEVTKTAGFTMASDVLTGSLLRTLAATKPSGKFLELGTGTGLSTSWILDGMDNDSTLISIDNDEAFLKIAKSFLGEDERAAFLLIDGEKWVEQNLDKKFDYIFADTWHGKYLLLNEVLAMLNKGGLYIIDDMLPQPNWPEGHDIKAIALLSMLQTKNDLFITPQAWSTGIVIAVKK